MNTLWQDLRSGLRMLGRSPGFTAVAVLALALGIGANTAIFSVVSAVLINPLPYQQADRLVMVWGNFLKLKTERMPAKAAEYQDYRTRTNSFDEIAAFNSTDYNLTGGDQPERIAGTRVTANLFSLLGAHVELGRTLLAEDGESGHDNVVIVSHNFWQKRFGGELKAAGPSIKLNDKSYQIIGVMPPEFQFPHVSFSFGEPAELWTPLVLDSAQVAKRDGPYFLNVVGRLKSGVSLEQARAELGALAQDFEKNYRGYRGPNGADGGWRITISPLLEEATGSTRFPLLILFGAVAFVLLIACANVANLLLMRATTRQKEMAIRAALGASRGRIVRQLLFESSLLGLLGGGAGLFLAGWGVYALAKLTPQNLPLIKAAHLDWRAFAFALLLSLLTGVVCGLAPALQGAKLNLNKSLKESGGSLAYGRHRLRQLLLVGEVAVAVLLLVGAGLLIHSFERLQLVKPGVAAEKLLTVEISLPKSRYPELTRATAFYDQLAERVAAAPGVQSASLSNLLPLSGTGSNDPFSIEGRPLDMSNLTVAGWQLVTPNYFQTLGISIISGRDFTEADHKTDHPSVTIINETMAQRYWPHENPVSKRMMLGAPQPDRQWLTIIGVARPVPHRTIASIPEPDWYLPYRVEPRRSMCLFVRTVGDPASVATEIRRLIWSIDKDQPISKISTMNEVIASTIEPRKFNTLLLSAFSAVALLLAAVGIYSVISYSVTQRRREIGVRMALGANAGDVMRMVLTQGMVPALAGIAAGLLAAFALTRIMSSLLFGVEPTDTVTFVLVSLLLTIVALLACWLPARRATKVDPLVALRYE
jgi:putative ABC transport system permease protein